MQRLDATLAAWTKEVDATSGSMRWLIPQTYYTKDARRALIRRLRTDRGEAWSPLLDAGCGIGAMALECAHLLGAKVVGLDLDSIALDRARHLGLVCGQSASWILGDVSAMPFADESFASAWSRLLFQHLPDPAQVLRELFRVLKSGGRLVIIDIDDGLLLEDPAPSSDWDALQTAFRTLQRLRGGDRFIGRRLPGLIHRAGFHIEHVEVAIDSVWHHRALQDISWHFDRLRLDEERQALCDAGLFTQAAWERAWEQREREFETWAFETAGLVVVVASKPGPQ